VIICHSGQQSGSHTLHSLLGVGRLINCSHRCPTWVAAKRAAKDCLSAASREEGSLRLEVGDNTWAACRHVHKFEMAAI
jgi:hypothetical protein